MLDPRRRFCRIESSKIIYEGRNNSCPTTTNIVLQDVAKVRLSHSSRAGVYSTGSRVPSQSIHIIILKQTSSRSDREDDKIRIP